MDQHGNGTLARRVVIVHGEIRICPVPGHCAESMMPEDAILEIAHCQNVGDVLDGECGDPRRHIITCPACGTTRGLACTLPPGQDQITAACPCGRTWLTRLPTSSWPQLTAAASWDGPR
jgi:hypothetical protein